MQISSAKVFPFQDSSNRDFTMKISPDTGKDFPIARIGISRFLIQNSSDRDFSMKDSSDSNFSKMARIEDRDSAMQICTYFLSHIFHIPFYSILVPLIYVPIFQYLCAKK